MMSCIVFDLFSLQSIIVQKLFTYLN
jgi:hypothetical protein